MPQRILFVLLFVAVLLQTTAQAVNGQSDREAILAVVQRFFDTIATGDTAVGREIILIDGQYFRLRQDGDSLALSRTTHRQFLQNLSGERSEMLERMWEPTVLQQGRMAVVWTPYDFHIDGQFSHCGVDAFNLIRTDDGWKIAGIMYTVEPTGCAPSPLGPPGGM